MKKIHVLVSRTCIENLNFGQLEVSQLVAIAHGSSYWVAVYDEVVYIAPLQDLAMD